MKLDAKISREYRRRLSATYPKCSCGNILGQQRFEEGIEKCAACLPDPEGAREQERELEAARAFFEHYGGYRVQLSYRESAISFSVDELFQHFKSRLQE